MKNRYLYRGKSIYGEGWQTGYLRFNSDGQGMINEHGTDTCEHIVEDTVGQCIGIKDKNGNLVFEGDQFEAEVLKSPKGKSSAVAGSYWVKTTCTICYHNGQFMGRWCMKAHLFSGHIFSGSGYTEILSSENLEIIGNIHD